MRIGLLYSRVRVEEKLLIEELTSRGIEHELIDVRTAIFDIHDPSPWRRFDVIFERCISQTQATNAVRIFESFGIPCVNPSQTIELCGDKLATSLRLVQHGVPTPRVRVALEGPSALEAIEQNGYPAVLKPTVGSWGRLLARVNDRDAAEAIVEHKETLGSVQHSVFYVQEYVNKPGRDLRVFIVGDRPIAAISRTSPHWITNTALGGEAAGLTIDADAADICTRAARAVGGGLLAIDLLECPERGLLVSEINHTMEFRNSIATTGVNIPGLMIDYVADIGRRGSIPDLSRTDPARIETKPVTTPLTAVDQLFATGAA